MTLHTHCSSGIELEKDTLIAVHQNPVYEAKACVVMRVELPFLPLSASPHLTGKHLFWKRGRGSVSHLTPHTTDTLTNLHTSLFFLKAHTENALFLFFSLLSSHTGRIAIPIFQPFWISLATVLLQVNPQFRLHERRKLIFQAVFSPNVH